jgi:hypothetical protein
MAAPSREGLIRDEGLGVEAAEIAAVKFKPYLRPGSSIRKVEYHDRLIHVY